MDVNELLLLLLLLIRMENFHRRLSIVSLQLAVDWLIRPVVCVCNELLGGGGQSSTASTAAAAPTNDRQSMQNGQKM